MAMSVEAVSVDAVATAMTVAVAAAATVVTVVVVVVVVAAAAAVAEIVVEMIAAEQTVVENTEARLQTWCGDSERPCVRESDWEVKGMES